MQGVAKFISRLLLIVISIPLLLFAGCTVLGVGYGVFRVITRPIRSAIISEAELSSIAIVGDEILLFVALWTGADARWELWKSNGTPAGTVLIKTVYSGSNGAQIYDVTPVGAQLVFRGNGVLEEADAYSWKNSVRLWQTDGTPEGTHPLEGEPEVSGVVNVNDEVFFSGVPYDAQGRGECVLGRHILATAETTFTQPLLNGCPHGLMTTGKQLLFFSEDKTIDASSCSLWNSDGTASETHLLVDFFLYGFENCYISEQWIQSNKLYLLIKDGRGRTELWASDGTADGTDQISALAFDWLKEPNPLLLTTHPQRAFRVYYADGSCGVWTTDGTPLGTILIEHFCPDDFALFGDALAFAIGNPKGGWDLRLRPPGADEKMLGHFGYGPESLKPRFLGQANGLFLIQIHDDEGCAVWATDGTAAGTQLLWRPCWTSLLDYHGQLLFTVQKTERAIELWMGDGTHAGTNLVDTIP